MPDRMILRWPGAPRRPALAAVALAVIALGPGGILRSSGAQGGEAPTGVSDGPGEYDEQIVPVLEAYCYPCHGWGESSGGTALDGWADAVAAVGDRATWQRVRRVILHHEMPPADEPQPAETDRQAILAWIDRQVLQIDCDCPDPGRVTTRRLNRAEYRNTVRDLLGVDFDPSEHLPVDPSGHGFDTIGDVLSVSPMLLEKYLRAAELAAQAAIVTPADRAALVRRYPLDLLEVGYNAKQQGNGWVTLTSVEEDDVVAVQDVKVGGQFLVRVRADAEQRGERPIELTFMLGEEAIETVVLEDRNPKTYAVRFHVAPGKARRFRVAMRRIKDGLPPEEAAIWKYGPEQDGSARLEWLEVEGPFDVRPEDLPESHRRLLARAGDPDDDPDARTRRILAPLVHRALRRPPEPEEVQRLVELARALRATGQDFETALQGAVTALLVSPEFLFRLEPLQEGPVPDGLPQAAAGAAPIDAYALASRLAYFLWSSLPDEQLLAEAEKGTLRQNLEAQVRRMLADDRATALTENFAGQWLELRNLENASPDRGQFADFDEPLRRAMRRETELLFETIMRDDRSVLELISADYTFVNERLARHYGLEGIEGDDFRRVQLPEGRRRGVLTHASILTLTSNPTRTSPVKRGKWVLENLLAAPPPPPPPGVPELPEPAGAEAPHSLRERMEIHRASPLCASCHTRMDAIGFALEHFDAVGQWRPDDHGEPIDASGELFAGQAFDGADELVALLAGPERDRVARCMAEKMLTYALGRGLEYYDVCAVEDIVRGMQASGYRFSSLVRGVVQSVPFQYARTGHE